MAVLSALLQCYMLMSPVKNTFPRTVNVEEFIFCHMYRDVCHSTHIYIYTHTQDNMTYHTVLMLWMQSSMMVR